MYWVQAYDPLNSALWSPVAAAIPIVVLLGLLIFGASAPRAAAAGLLTALGVAIGVFKMPTSAALASAGYGACFGLLPIGWIVFAAVFLYHLTVRTGQFEVLKRSVSAISPDRRMQSNRAARDASSASSSFIASCWPSWSACSRSRKPTCSLG